MSMHVHVILLCSLLPASLSSPASAPASLAVVAHARSTPMHVAHNSWSDTGGVQGPTGRVPTWVHTTRGASSQWSASILLGGVLSLSGSCPLGWEMALATVTTSPIFQKEASFFSLWYFLGEFGFLFLFTAGYACS